MILLNCAELSPTRTFREEFLVRDTPRSADAEHDEIRIERTDFVQAHLPTRRIPTVTTGYPLPALRSEWYSSRQPHNLRYPIPTHHRRVVPLLDVHPRPAGEETGFSLRIVEFLLQRCDERVRSRRTIQQDADAADRLVQISDGSRILVDHGEPVALQFFCELHLHERRGEDDLRRERPQCVRIDVLMIRKMRRNRSRFGIVTEVIRTDDLLLLLEREENFGHCR